MTRFDYQNLCSEFGTDAICEETAILNSTPDDLLPPCALTVKNGGEPSEDYWDFLAAQTEAAQREHDLEYATGHEWHAD
jgi:hypothetical protein